MGLRWLIGDRIRCKQHEGVLGIECPQLKKQAKTLLDQAKANQQLKQEIAQCKRTEAALRKQIQQLNAELERQAANRLQSNRLHIHPSHSADIRTAELEQTLKFEAMLKRITDKVGESLDESQILQTAVQELVSVLRLKGCNAGLYDGNQTRATISYEYTPEVPALQGKVVSMAELAQGCEQLLQRCSFQFCELVTFGGEAAILACPIVDNQRVLGDLWLFKDREDRFNELEIRLVQQVANQCAIAIHQARLYQEIQAQVQELEKLNHLKDEFLSTVSHELRTPISNMKMAIQMLALTLNREQPFLAELAKPYEEQSKLARYFQILQNECEREIKLINDVLDLQRLEGGTQPEALAAIHLPDWLPELAAPFQERAQRRQQTLQLDISLTLTPFLCDQASLERIITELLNNACKYTPPNEEIILKAGAKLGLLQLSVINSGVEIPASELSRIFDKFYRIPSTDPWKQGGTGLGLALVKKLVTPLGGIVEVQSQNNQTCFTVTLPLQGIMA